ncbi:unnamed protein product [Mytilus edulis]|uniref:Uncharacterized protein n=1 Tax=Mytilus edulis TaxID=6550 RepID=A0A8S3TXC2_MYTED|nr:unnamed protein product [Mytilus edulis]
MYNCDYVLINKTNCEVKNRKFYIFEEASMEDLRKHLMVAAVDFGTTYSGYSFSMRADWEDNPLKISNPIWRAGSRQFVSEKTPTCLLLNSNREFVAFGFEAENKWIDLLLDNEHNEYYYFERFKMNLHNNKSQKRFMRSCAEGAGIPTNNLILALEPEAASIFCQFLSTEKLKGSDPGFTMTAEGTKFMVVDLGGGTADITVHEKAANGHLKEKHRAIGNDCGGTSIDRRFFKLFEEIIGKTTMDSLKKESPLAYIDLIREFESVKRTVETETKTKVTMTIPVVALETSCQKVHNKNLESLLADSSYSKDIKLAQDKIRIHVEVFNKMFMPSVDSVISLMKEIFQDKSLKDVTHLLMVGGFSDCQLMHDAVRQAFPEKKIIIPEEAGLAVLKGAVLFGHDPEYIQSRIMRCSYGVKTNVPWHEKI